MSWLLRSRDMAQPIKSQNQQPMNQPLIHLQQAEEQQVEPEPLVEQHQSVKQPLKGHHKYQHQMS